MIDFVLTLIVGVIIGFILNDILHKHEMQTDLIDREQWQKEKEKAWDRPSE